jgi:hypothetical protein
MVCRYRTVHGLGDFINRCEVKGMNAFLDLILFAGFFVHSPVARHTHNKILRWRLFIVLVPIGKTTRCCNSVEVFRGNFEISRGFNTRTVPWGNRQSPYLSTSYMEKTRSILGV